MNSEEKNLLDLQHSLSLTKGALFLSIGIGGSISLFLGLKDTISLKMSIAIISVFSTPFIYKYIAHFENCKEIQKKIKKEI